ncbi:MAG: hypothetical protein ACK6BU_12105 [Cyanobacteriota bacterium]
MNADLIQLVAAAADLCRKPFRHAVLVRDDLPVPVLGQGILDCCLTLQVRDASGERCPEADLELEIYQSGNDLHLTLAWMADDARPILWQGSHPVWMDGLSGLRCERPDQGAPLETLARRLRALLAGSHDGVSELGKRHGP